MHLSAVSVLVVAQSSSEIPEGHMNNPVFWLTEKILASRDGICFVLKEEYGKKEKVNRKKKRGLLPFWVHSTSYVRRTDGISSTNGRSVTLCFPQLQCQGHIYARACQRHTDETNLQAPFSKWPTWHTTLLFYNTFITVLYMFRATSSSSSGGQIVLIQHLVSSLSVSDRPVHTCAPDGHLQRVTIPDAVLNFRHRASSI